MTRRVGEWEVLRELARGGQGAVLRARHAVHGTPAALKLLLRVELETVLRFKQEAAVLLRLNHPNLVRVYEAGEHDGAPFLAMELVEGQSLADLVREGGPPPFARTVTLLAAVARGLHHCHGQGVVHRDVKPENIIVERATGRPVLVDFGLVKRDRERFGALSIDEVTRLSRSGELRGTPLFMAPEQVAPGGEQGEVGPATDVHALGSLLHVLLTGAPPHEAESLPDLLRAILTGPPADPRATNPAAPAALAALSVQARALDPAARPRSAAAFAAALEAAPLEARPRGRAGLALAGLLLAGAGAAAAVVVARRPASSPAPELLAPVASSLAPAPAPAPGDDRVERALAALEADPALARSLADEALAAAPGDLRARGARAAALLELGLRGEAAATEVDLRSVVGADPSLGWALGRDGAPDPRLHHAWSSRGLRRIADGDVAGALEDAERALALRADDPVALVLRAQARLARAEDAAARADLDRALARAPRLAQGWLLRAEARLRLGEPREALAELARADALAPAPQDPNFTRARALLALGDRAAALAELDRLLARPGADEVAIRGRRADLLLHLGRFPDALAEVEAVLRRAPREARALAVRGALRWRREERERARADFAAADAALESDLEPGPRAAALVDRARLRRGAGDVDGALADVERALALGAGWDARTIRGTLLFARGRAEEARADFDAVLAARPRVVDALVGRGQARKALGDAAGAVEDYTRALALDGVDAPGVVLLRALGHLALADLAAARADAARCVELAPERYDAWLLRGAVRRAQRDLPGALADLDRAVELEGDAGVLALTDRLETRRLADDGPGALADARRITELRPDAPNGWLALGAVLRLSGDLAGALPALDRAIERGGEGPAAVAALHHRGICRRQTGDLAGARADLERCVALRADSWGAWFDLGLTLSAAGDVAAAEPAYARALELAPRSERPGPLLARGDLRLNRGDAAAARADFDQAVELDPSRYETWSARGWCRHAQRDHAGALEDLARALALAPEQPSPWRNRAWVRRALRDWAGAEADATRALELAPRDGETASLRALLRQRRGDFAGAVSDHGRALELGHAPVTSLRGRAFARRDQGDVEGCLADLALALQKDPRAIEVLVTRAQLHRDWREDLDAALADEEAALALDPASPLALRSRALTRLRRGDLRGARADADEAARLAPNAVESLACRSRVLLGQRELAAARRDAERAVALDDASSLSQWALALALQAAGDAAGCVAACDRSIAAEGGRAPKALATRAEALVTLGRPQDALLDLDRAVAIDARADPLLARAALREAAGDRAGAAADLRAALERLRPGDPRRPATSAALAEVTR